MRYLAVGLFVAVISFPCFAQNSNQYRICSDKAKTQAELNICASKEGARVEAELNDVYRRLLSKAKSQTAAIEKIKAAERIWIAYRDAYIDAMYPAKDKQAEYGSIYPMEVDLVRARLTQRQVAALKEMLGQYSEATISRMFEGENQRTIPENSTAPRQP